MVDALLDDVLDEGGRSAVDAHLSRCADCRSFRNGARRVRDVLRDQPLVPASDLAVRRMWEALDRRLDEPARPERPAGRSWWLVAACAAAVVLGTAGAVAWTARHASPPPARLAERARPAGEVRPAPPLAPSPPADAPALPAIASSIIGGSRVVRSGNDRGSSDLERAAVERGDHVVTASGSAAEVGIGEDIVVHLGPESDVALARLDPSSPSLELAAGWVVCHVVHREPPVPFTVVAGGMEVRVTGTVFAVERTSGGAVDVRVAQGSVEVVTAGEPAVIVEADRAASFPRARVRALEPTLAARDAALARGELTPDREPVVEASLDELFEQAEADRREGRYDRAAAIYRRIAGADRSGAAGGTAMISLGQLCLGRLGRPDEARLAFATYLSRQPGGALRQEAYVGLLRSHRALGQSAEAARVARRYLDEFPAGRYREAAEEELR
jgi:hypothetical protein